MSSPKVGAISGSGGSSSISKASKKRKLDNAADSTGILPDTEEIATEPRNNKKRRNTQRKPAQSEQTGEALQSQDEAFPETTLSAPESTDVVDGRSQRFIVFIGNLPYTATKEQVSQHFSKLQPTSVRLQTDRITGKSKGFAFIEFAGYDKMKTCLKLYHHSLFDNGKGESRKINVELTAGGGGSKSKQRRQKLKEKNQKLEQERARSIQENKKKKVVQDSKVETSSKMPAREVEESAVHPSRRQWVPRV